MAQPVLGALEWPHQLILNWFFFYWHVLSNSQRLGCRTGGRKREMSPKRGPRETCAITLEWPNLFLPSIFFIYWQVLSNSQRLRRRTLYFGQKNGEALVEPVPGALGWPHLFVLRFFFFHWHVLQNSWRLKRRTVCFGHETEMSPKGPGGTGFEAPERFLNSNYV